jgi:hypothetical protein
MFTSLASTVEALYTQLTPPTRTAFVLEVIHIRVWSAAIPTNAHSGTVV